VLAHSLKDAGTTKKIAVLVTMDTVSADAMAQLQVRTATPPKPKRLANLSPLQTLFDFIIPVERIVNESAANLSLMGRLDLHSTFTKIALWKQLQFRKIVYMDADMVALRAPEELFDLPYPFSAAPDIGWPDIFNTGLLVLTPNMGDYYALLAMAQRGISFDGADQGLLNMHFKDNFNRLSFTYNVTPSAHYQYLPAYRHFQSSISAAHFIGQDKPWFQGREANRGSTPYDEMVGRWWAVYDKHYRESVSMIPHLNLDSELTFHSPLIAPPRERQQLCNTTRRENSSP
jgi:glycogenin glucosyltransferase